MKIKLLNKPGVLPPANAHNSDTGYDIIAISEPKIVGKLVEGSEELYHSIDYIEYDTGLQIAPENLYYDGDNFGFVQIFPRSSISKYNLLLCNSVGICDHNYRGSIMLRFKYIAQPNDLHFIENIGIVCLMDKTKIYRQNDKIGQMVPEWKTEIDWEIVETLDETTRANGGFGSSDAPKNSGPIV